MLIIGYSRAAAPAAGVTFGMTRFVVQPDSVGGFNNSCVLSVPPGVAPGSLMVAAFPLAANGNDRLITGVPGGWSLIASGPAGAAGDGFFVYAKVAGAGEGGTSYTWNLSASANCVFAFAEVAGGDINRIEASFSGTSIDPPPHAPAGGSAETVWIALAKYTNQLATATAAPPGYSAVQFAQSWTGTGSNEVRMGGAWKQGTAASDDPGPFTWSGTGTAPQAATISIRAA